MSLVNAGHMWRRIVDEVGEEYPDVSVDYCHIDAATIYMVTDPGRFDVIVTDNLFGDIITDLAGAVTGGIGYAASGNINAVGEFPSMFEPVHVRARHRGAGEGRPDRDHFVGRAHARLHGIRQTRQHVCAQPSTPTWRREQRLRPVAAPSYAQPPRSVTTSPLASEPT